MNGIMSSEKALTSNQMQYTCDCVEDIVQHLSPRALQELLNGYDNDIDKFILAIISETNNIINFQQQVISSDKLFDLKKVESTMHERLKLLSYNYFKVSCLPEFSQNWRNLEWGNMAQLYPYLALLASRSSGKSYEFSFAYPLWKLYRYERPTFFEQKTLENKLSKEGVIVSNALKLGAKLIGKMVDEIQINDVLRERIVGEKGSNATLAGTKIVSKSGSSVELRSFNNTIRGLHPGWIVVDDFLDKSAIYSSEQRAKFKEVYFAEIMPALEPGGDIVTVGTPFHPDDLYADLRKDDRFKLFEYPAIVPGKGLLAPDRYDLKKLEAERKTLGTIVFAREYLITPISNSSSIFPWEFLERSMLGMEKIGLVDNISSFPIKMKRVVVACDLAISGNIGADSCAYITCGLGYDNNFYVMNIWSKQGASHNEQVEQMVSLDARFKPNKIIVENNGFQRVIAQLARTRGLKNVEEFTQTAQKKDLLMGLPAVGAAFERGEMRFPAKEDEGKPLVMKTLNELSSISFDDDKGTLEATSGHDDLAVSLYMGYFVLKLKQKELKVSMI